MENNFLTRGLIFDPGWGSGNKHNFYFGLRRYGMNLDETTINQKPCGPSD